MAKYPDIERSRVVLIGTSDYERHALLPRLPAIHNNLTALEAALTDTTSGVFTSEYCSVVDNPDSPRSLMARLTRGANQAEDVLFVYYAGHGVLDWNGDLHLTVRETDPDQIAGTAVPFEWIRQALRDSPALIRILILDCCFSGQAVGTMSSDSAALNQIEVTGTYILTSTTANRPSISVPGEKYTAFTSELIKLLTTKNETPLLLGDLYRPLCAAMAKRGLPRPRSRTVDSSGDLVLRRRLAAQPLLRDVPDSFTETVSRRGQRSSSRQGAGLPEVRTTHPTADADRKEITEPVRKAPPPIAKPAIYDSSSKDGVVNGNTKTGKPRRVARAFVAVLAASVGVLSLGTLAAGVAETASGNYSGGSLGGAITGLILLCLVILGCLEVLLKALRLKHWPLTKRGTSRVASKIPSVGHKNLDLQEQEAAHADEPYGTHTSHENAYAEFTKKSLAALAAVDTPASAHAFARHTARQIQNMAAQVPQFYAEEFFNIFKDAVVTQTQADAADCERMIKDAKAEADAASAELQAHLLAARAAGDQQAEHKVWRERKAKQTACQTKIDEASKRADILGTHIEACNQLATVLGLSFD